MSDEESEPEEPQASAAESAKPTSAEEATPRAESAGQAAHIPRSVGQSYGLAEAFAPTTRMIVDIQRQLASNTRLMQSIYESIRFVDRMMPQLVKPLELAATAEIARALSGSSALFTARVALVADLKLAETLKAIQIPAAQLSALTYASRAIASISEALLARTRFYPDVDRAIAHVVAGWRVAVSLPRMQPPINLDRLTAAGATTLGMATAGSVIVGSPPSSFEVATWEEASTELRDRMRARLSDIDPGLPRKLDGVWERVSAPGPDAASQAANSLIKVVDWFLRLAAPESDVLSWHTETQGPESQLTKDRRPTRALRVNYVLMTANRDAKPARRFTTGLLDILEFLQGAKHGLDFDDVEAVRRLVLAVEALFTYILILIPGLVYLVTGPPRFLCPAASGRARGEARRAKTRRRA